MCDVIDINRAKIQSNQKAFHEATKQLSGVFEAADKMEEELRELLERWGCSKIYAKQAAESISEDWMNSHDCPIPIWLQPFYSPPGIEDYNEEGIEEMTEAGLEYQDLGHWKGWCEKEEKAK